MMQSMVRKAIGERRLRLDNMNAMEGPWEVLKREWRQDVRMVARGLDTRIYPKGWALAGKLEEQRRVIGDMRERSMAEVLRVVCDVCCAEPDEITQISKQRVFARRRAMVAMLIRKACPGVSLPAIGRFLKRDHTTILNALKRFPAYLESDPHFAAEFAECCRHFGIKP